MYGGCRYTTHLFGNTKALLFSKKLLGSSRENEDSVSSLSFFSPSKCYMSIYSFYTAIALFYTAGIGLCFKRCFRKLVSDNLGILKNYYCYNFVEAGCKAVVAESYARIFFRNCVATGELYPVETKQRLCESLKTGTMVTLDLNQNILTDNDSGKVYELQDLGDVGPVIDAGGIFQYARQTGMI